MAKITQLHLALSKRGDILAKLLSQIKTLMIKIIIIFRFMFCDIKSLSNIARGFITPRFAVDKLSDVWLEMKVFCFTPNLKANIRDGQLLWPAFIHLWQLNWKGKQVVVWCGRSGWWAGTWYLPNRDNTLPCVEWNRVSL